jgi:hypothetical protein
MGVWIRAKDTHQLIEASVITIEADKEGHSIMVEPSNNPGTAVEVARFMNLADASKWFNTISGWLNRGAPGLFQFGRHDLQS